MSTMNHVFPSSARRAAAAASWLLSTALPGSACADGAPLDEEAAELTQATQALVGEDGLAQAYQFFRENFTLVGFDRLYRIGAGVQPGMSTEIVKVGGLTGAAKVFIDFRS